MDLRTQRTRKSIINAFITLRSKKPIEKITVKELAELAVINKATFYLHYEDIYDLSRQLQSEIIANIYNNINHPEWVFDAPSDFSKELWLAFQSQRRLIDILFSGQEAVLPKSIEQELRNHIFSIRPELKDNVEFNTLLTYEVQGGFYAHIENSKRFNDESVFSVMTKITEILSKEFREKKIMDVD